MTQCTDSLGPVMVLGPDRKLGIKRDTTIQPFQPKREEIEIRLPKKLQAIDLQVKLSYRLRPGDEIPLHLWRRRVSVTELYKGD